jgi:hypothetical protein
MFRFAQHDNALMEAFDHRWLFIDHPINTIPAWRDD